MADGLAGQIDGYLKSKGSPLSGYGNVFVASGKKYGVDPRLVVGISGAESSFGKYLFRPFNAWGWMSGDDYGSWQQSINAVTKGLASGYIQQGLTTPADIVSKYAPASAGNDETTWSSNVSTFMREMGAAPVLTTSKTRVPSAAKSASKVTLTPPSSLTPMSFAPSNAGIQAALQSNLGLIAQRGHASGQSMLNSVLQGVLQDRLTDQANQAQADIYNAALAKLSQAQPSVGSSVPPASTGSSPPASSPQATLFKVKIGQPLPPSVLTSVGAEHATSGLPGYPAHDYFAAPGSPAVAPVSGTVVKLSGYDPKLGPVEGVGGPLGWSIYIRAANGSFYYMTHMGSRDVKVGDVVKLGQQVGTVADYDKYGGKGFSHIHMGVGSSLPG